MTLAHLDATFVVPDGIGDEHRVFAFEADFAHDLRCIPMVVRFKLDRCGVKLSLRQWSKMGVANRMRLLKTRCDTAGEIQAFRMIVVDLATTHCSEAIRWLPRDPEPTWANSALVPVDVTRQAAELAVAPPSPQCWRGLSTLQRYALLKLARSNHDNHNFVPAMREMQIPL